MLVARGRHRAGADAPRVRSVIALHELPRRATARGQRPPAGLAGEEGRERLVCAAGADFPQHAIDALEVGDPARLAPVGLPVLGADGAGHQMGLLQNAQRVGGFAVDELGAQLDGERNSGVVVREDSAADAIARLEDADAIPFAHQFAGRGETRDSRSNHGHVQPLHRRLVPFRHPPVRNAPSRGAFRVGGMQEGFTGRFRDLQVL
jgi:hypothetical protein